MQDCISFRTGGKEFAIDTEQKGVIYVGTEDSSGIFGEEITQKILEPIKLEKAAQYKMLKCCGANCIGVGYIVPQAFGIGEILSFVTRAIYDGIHKS